MDYGRLSCSTSFSYSHWPSRSGSLFSHGRKGRGAGDLRCFALLRSGGISAKTRTASCDLLVATDVVMYLLLGSSGMKPFGVSCDVKWGAKYQPFLWYNCALLDALWAISAIKGNCSSSPVLRYLQVSIRMGYNTIILCGKIQCL